MTPFVSDPDFTLYVGDALEVLRELPASSVDCCVTSPPYWGLRDYGTEGQLGLEATPGEYVERMVEVFAEVRRALADTGTLWLNLGDSYAGGPAGNSDETFTAKQASNAGSVERRSRSTLAAGLKPKDLVGIPWRVAFALQDAGWYLRADVIWSKPNPMPESVTDRPTKAHEYVFLLSKSPRYYFDQEAVREKYGNAEREWWNENRTAPGNPNRNDGGGIQSRPASGPDGRRKTGVLAGDGSIQHRDGDRWPNLAGRNVRSVWEIPTQPYPDAHFATFPEELPRRCIAAGCPEWVCRACGKPRERIVEREASGRTERDGASSVVTLRNDAAAHEGRVGEVAVHTLGWSDCGHDNYRPGIVLDPFMGSATTALVARKLGRRSIGIELNPKYARLAAKRLGQQSLLAEAAS